MNKNRLDLVKADFLKDLRPKYIMKDLLKYNIVTDEEKEKILSVDNSQEQVKKLFQVLSPKGPKELEIFIKVLNLEDEFGVYYPWLAKKLNETNITHEIERRRDLKDNVHELLTDGGVPFQTNCLLHRESKIKEIREKLKQATNRSFKNTPWVVLHGMSGTGKSVLAAEAVRDNELIEKYFQNGVFWLPLGCLSDINALGIKMKKLYQKILESRNDLESESKSNSAVEKLDDLTDNLKRLVTRKMLVVLDDLWYDPVINPVKYLNIGCPILVTTKFPGAFDIYSQFCEKIECKNNWQINEGKELLALYVKCNIDDLPPIVNSVCKNCKGSPFTLSHIGRYMAPFGNDVERWEYLNSLLEKGRGKAIRQRHASDNDLNEIKEIVLQTLQPIKEDKDLFYDFVIFPEDVWVPAQVLTVLWNKNIFEVEETMYCLVNKSLVQFEKDTTHSYSYGIHDLYLEILNEICEKNDIEERHLRLINNYLKLCIKEDGKRDFSCLPDDDYIHYYIGHHIDKMGSLNRNKIIDGITLDDIYFDLNFIEKKLQKDPKDLLWDYYQYRALFQSEEHLEIFETFVKKHAYKIFNNKECDIVQLGLFEPENSIIYKKSLILALKANNKLYFQWCNQDENQPHMQNLNVKLNPFQDTKHAAISCDGSLVACVGSDNKASVFSNVSGEELLTLSGHTAAINYCMFNSSRSKLVTASNDKTVKIFELNLTYSTDMKPTKKRLSFPVINTEDPKTPDMAVVTFTEHNAEVLCCCYSFDENLIVSSDSIGVAYVRRGMNAELICKTNPENSEITACSLSNDCSEVVYGMKDGKVKIFNVENKDVDSNLPGHLAQVNYIIHSKDIFFTCSEDKTIKIWDGDRLSPKILKGHRHSVVMCVPFKNSPQRLLSCSKDGTLKVWEITSGKCIFTTEEGHGNQDIRCCDISSDDRFLASASADGTVKLWFAENGVFFRTLKCGSEVRSCCFSPFSQILISGCDSGEVRLWRYGKKVSSDFLCQHSSCVYNIYFNKSQEQFLSIADDIKIWTKEQAPQTLLLPSYYNGVARPSIWASDNFDKLVVILNSVLYVLKKIENDDKNLLKAKF